MYDAYIRKCRHAFSIFISEKVDHLRARRRSFALSGTEYVTAMDTNRRAATEAMRSPKDLMSILDSKIHEYVKEVCRWVAANPNKIESRLRVLDTYCETTYNTTLDDMTIFANDLVQDTSHRTASFVLDYELMKHQHVAIVGSRGEGKTAFLNYWLTKRHDAFESGNITWFRFDVTKVYKIFPAIKFMHSNVLPKHLNDRPSTPGMSVVDAYKMYFRAHSIFVAICYGSSLGNDPMGWSLDAFLGCDNKSRVLRDIIAKMSERDHDLIIKCCSWFKSVVMNYEIKYSVNSRTSSEFLSAIKGKDHSVEVVSRIVELLCSDSECYNLTQRFFDCLRSVVIQYKYAIYVIFDGIDNIDWTKRDDFYNFSCSLFTCIWDNCRLDIGEEASLIICSREETLSEIADSLIYPGWNKIHFAQIKQLKLRAAPLAHIIQRKMEAALTSRGFETRRNELIASCGIARFTQAIEWLKKSSVEFSKNISDDIINTLTFSGGSLELLNREDIDNYRKNPNEIILTIFDYDFRAMLDVFIKVANVHHFYHKAEHNPANVRRRFMQYVFLNSRTFFHTEINTSGARTNGRKLKDRGSVFPNIFWYNTNMTRKMADGWQGNIGMLVIIIGSMRHRFPLCHLMSILIDVFKYNVSVVIEVIEAFVAFSIIDVDPQKGNEESPDVNWACFNLVKEYTNTAYITEKGKIYLEYLLRRPDIMYLFALDTPMLSSFVYERSQYVRLARNYTDLDIENDFMTAVVTTMGVFLWHVNRRHMQDIKNLEELKCNDINYNLISEFLRDDAGAERLYLALGMIERIEAIMHKYIELTFIPSVDKEVAESRYTNIFGALNVE